jgi:hypothetical protein
MNGRSGPAFDHLSRDGFRHDAAAAERRIRRLIVGVLLLGWLAAHAVLRWWL